MAKLEQEAHRVALSALAQQERALTELRGRTGTLFTASSLVSSLLGGQVLAKEGFGIWIVLAFIALGLSMVLCVYVLLPRDSLVFSLDGPVAYEALYGVREDEAEISRRLTYWLESFRKANHPIVKRLRTAFVLAGFALLAAVGFLTIPSW